jgi:hypothetical protein
MSTAIRPDVTVVLPTFELSYVMAQLSTESQYADWTLERFEKAEAEYRRFLALCRAFSNRSLGISPDADKVWHRHILNTRRYIADCEVYFGHYFHHTPVCDDIENLAAQQETNELFLEVFGENRKPSTALTCVGKGCMNNG